MKILYIADYQSKEVIQRRQITSNVHDGANTKISRIARGLAKRGHTVAVLATGIAARRSGRWSAGFNSAIDGSVTPVRYGSSVDVPVLNHLVGAGSMRLWARRNGPWDCVLMYNFGFEAVATCLSLCKFEHIPLVVEYEDDAKMSLGGENRLHRYKGELAIGCLQSQIGGALVVTERLRSHIRTPNVLVLPGVVEDGHVPSGTWLQTGRPTVMYCGGMNYLKGPDILLNALQYTHREVDVHFFGTGPMLGELRELARGVSRHSVSIHGRVEEEVLLEYFDRAALFVNPHRLALGHDNSLFPFKVFEYLATGKPVVTSQVSQLTPSIELGLVRYDGDSPRALAESLNLCLAKYSELSAKALLAAEEINSLYSVSAVAERVEQVLKSA